jgi:hypothetical protein
MNIKVLTLTKQSLECLAKPIICGAAYEVDGDKPAINVISK